MLVVYDYEDEDHEAMERLGLGQEDADSPDDPEQQLHLLHQ